MSNSLQNLVLAGTRPAVLALANRGSRASTAPFDGDYALRPYRGGRVYGWTHYGVMIPQLPAPHRYLSVMIMAGMPGHRAFDVDEVVRTTPRDTVTISISTAVTAHYSSLSISGECNLQSDGQRLQFGSLLTLSGSHPEFTVQAGIPGLEFDLQFSMAERATWFVKGLPYHHLSLLGEFAGVVWTGDSALEVAGRGNIEYARCVGPYSLRDRLLPRAWKVPLDFFTYNVIELPDAAQLLFSRVGMLSQRVGDVVQYRTVSGAGDWRVNEIKSDRTYFTVLEYEPVSRVDQAGHRMLLPKRFELGVVDRVHVTGVLDTKPRYGVGRGYIWGYEAVVEMGGTTLQTRGYCEYVDVRPW